MDKGPVYHVSLPVHDQLSMVLNVSMYNDSGQVVHTYAYITEQCHLVPAKWQ